MGGMKKCLLISVKIGTMNINMKIEFAVYIKEVYEPTAHLF